MNVLYVLSTFVIQYAFMDVEKVSENGYWNRDEQRYGTLFC